MYQVVVLGVQGKGHLVAHCAYFCVIEPRRGYVCPLVCIKVVCLIAPRTQSGGAAPPCGGPDVRDQRN